MQNSRLTLRIVAFRSAKVALAIVAFLELSRSERRLSTIGDEVWQRGEIAGNDLLGR